MYFQVLSISLFKNTVSVSVVGQMTHDSVLSKEINRFLLVNLIFKHISGVPRSRPLSHGTACLWYLSRQEPGSPTKQTHSFFTFSSYIALLLYETGCIIIIIAPICVYCGSKKTEKLNTYIHAALLQWHMLQCICEFCVTLLPSQKEGDVESWTVKVDKLKKEHLEGKAVLPLRLRPRLFCGGEERKEERWDKLIKWDIDMEDIDTGTAQSFHRRMRSACILWVKWLNYHLNKILQLYG